MIDIKNVRQWIATLKEKSYTDIQELEVAILIYERYANSSNITDDDILKIFNLYLESSCIFDEELKYGIDGIEKDSEYKSKYDSNQTE